MRKIWWMVALAALCGCAGPKGTEPAAQPAPGAAVVDVKAGTVGNLKLGMTPDEAVATFGPPETRYDDFLAWKGGKVTALIASGRVYALRVTDRSYSVHGFHVGESLEAAQRVFPGGEFEAAEEVPVYELPGSKYAWLEVVPTVDREILAVHLSERPRPEEHH